MILPANQADTVRRERSRHPLLRILSGDSPMGFQMRSVISTYKRYQIMKPQTNDKGLQESFWKSLAKYQWGCFVNFLWAAVPGILVLVLSIYFPRLGIYLFLPFAIIVAIMLLRVLWRVFRPDDPTDLSLR
jgi:hypothetical protein